MLSKIVIILLSILLLLVSFSFLGQVEATNIQSLFLPNFAKLDFSKLPLIIILIMSLILMVLGILFSSIESSAKVNKLLNFLKDGMPEENLSKLDKVSQSIAEYIKGIGADSVAESLSSVQEVENNSEEQKEQKEEEASNTKNSEPEKKEIEEFHPDLPPADEFEGEDKKTIIASSFNLDGLKSLKEEKEEESFAPSNFSDFADDDDSSKGAETVIASVPEELLRESQNTLENNRENDFKNVYNKFYEMKVELGEATSSLTQEAFIKKLKDTEKKLISTNNCKKVEFTVYNKNGKVALKATPKY